MSRKKTEIYQTFLASLKGGGYPQFGKRLNYFRFFLVKASLSETLPIIFKLTTANSVTLSETLPLIFKLTTANSMTP